jgi:hypothetical protein
METGRTKGGGLQRVNDLHAGRKRKKTHLLLKCKKYNSGERSSLTRGCKG